MQPRSVYVHIPFCMKMCHYCDFATYTVKGQPVDAYLDALESEMHLALHGSPAGEVDTIFVGGGTPTVLTAAQMERFLSIVGKYFPHRSDDLEFTVEANPGTVDLEKLAVMRDGGVNRLSLGAQSFDDHLLQAIGRDHDARTVIESIDVATSAGFHNISLDLMYGLPGQTVDVLDDTLEVTLRLGLQHVSAYALKIEENTLFYSLQRKGQLSLPTDDEEYEMYQLVRQRMAESGYVQYEVSNFSLDGFESRHNQTYWRNEPYYAFGVGAHGFTDGVRFANVRGLKPYIQAAKEKRLPRADQYKVSRKEDMENTVILGLRMREGVSTLRFEQRFGVRLADVYGDHMKELEQKGWLTQDERSVRLTESGLLWGNEVFARFIS